MYRIKSVVTCGARPQTLLILELCEGRYQLRREIAQADGEGVLVAQLAEGGLEAIVTLYERAKQCLIQAGCRIANEWEGAGSAQHELALYGARKGSSLRISVASERIPVSAKRVQACFKRGLLAFTGADLSTDDQATLKAVLGHASLAGKVFDVVVGPKDCLILEALSPGSSVAALYAQVPGLKRLLNPQDNGYSALPMLDLAA